MIIEQDDSYISKGIAVANINAQLYELALDMAVCDNNRNNQFAYEILEQHEMADDINPQTLGNLARSNGWEHWVEIRPQGVSEVQTYFADSLIPQGKDGDIIDLPIKYTPLGVTIIEGYEDEALKAKDFLTPAQKFRMRLSPLFSYKLKENSNDRKRQRKIYKEKEKFYKTLIRALT